MMGKCRILCWHLTQLMFTFLPCFLKMLMCIYTVSVPHNVQCLADPTLVLRKHRRVPARLVSSSPVSIILKENRIPWRHGGSLQHRLFHRGPSRGKAGPGLPPSLSSFHTAWKCHFLSMSRPSWEREGGEKAPGPPPPTSLPPSLVS